MKTVAVDFAAPGYVLGEPERKQGMTHAKVTAFVLNLLMGARFPQGMDGKDGRIWAQYLDAFTAEEETLEVAEADFFWLHRIVSDDDVRILAGLQHWRMALARYFDELYQSQKKRAAEV